ncbi:MAG TPA: ribose 5-phosphate isomerase B [Candidatus Acidoferrales bacterium]|jgi:ribose 5-phosphate isomerase B|nr:ribose 5-phosphate isomerase B [Candidatus Acidoferrales bacterium]
MRPVVTNSDLERIPNGGEFSIAADALITPLARDEAARRGIVFRLMDPKAAIQPGGAPTRNAAAAFDRHVVAIAADHGGFELKEKLKVYIVDWGYELLDLGTNSTEAVDYPDFAVAAAEAVVAGRAWRGVVIDSAGIGSAIAANKVPGARAALCYDFATARNSREHNDANILTLGAKLISPELAREILAAWLETKFGGGRHAKRVEKITAIEARYSGAKLPGPASK